VSGDAYADFLVGRVANLNADYAVAAEHYQAALARSPHDEDLLDGAVSSALASGDADRAVEIARQAPRLSGSPYVQLVRGASDMVASRWSDAARDLSAVHGSGAQEFLAAMLAIWANAGRGRPDVLNDDLRPLLSVPPYGALLYYQQAMVYDFAGRNDDAIHFYDDGDRGGLWAPPVVVRHADLLMRTGAHEQALAIIADDRNAASPDVAVAAARARAGQALAPAPLTPARGAAIGLYGVAAIYLQQSDSANGLAALTLAQMLDPALDAARVAIAEEQSRLGHLDLALQMLNSIPATSDYASSARAMEMWTLIDQGKNDQAVSLAEQSAASGDYREKRALGDVYRRLGRYDRAEAVYSELIATHGDDWRLYFARGVARMHLNRPEDGEADMQHALALSPDQPDVLNYLGYSWIDRGVHADEAMVMIQRAVALRPNSGPIADSLGWAYFKSGDYEHAVDALEHAVQLDPGDATLNEHLGDAYWRVGRRTEARFQWSHALTQTPDDADALHQKLAHGLPPAPSAHSARR
jgi:tetratricopeptide (TPR) repeat protein